MKVLLLTPYDYFEGPKGDTFHKFNAPITDCEGYDFLVSYGYRYKIPDEVVNKMKGKAINLHISYLPWNRGADPNLWSFIDDTPKGVTIHNVANGIDTGDILVQRKIKYEDTETLKTIYNRLRNAVEVLFFEHWDDIKQGKIKPVPQMTYHRGKDKEYIMSLMPKGWDTTVEELKGLMIK